MDAIISLIVFIFVIISVINKAKKNGANTANSKKNTYEKVQTRKEATIRQTSSHVKPTIKSETIASLRDDKDNDWLARQLREEHKAFKMTRDMFNLKIEHVSHCDAQYIKQFHRSHCDSSGIDTATGH